MNAEEDSPGERPPGPAGGVRFHWGAIAPWAVAVVAFVIAVETVPEVLDVGAVEGGLLPLVAAAAAAPLGLIATRPTLGWFLSAASALVVSQAFPVLDGDPWRFPTIHGLTLLALLFAVAFRPARRFDRLRRLVALLVAWGVTAALFAVSVPDRLRPGWVVAVTAVVIVGAGLRWFASRRGDSPATTDDGISLRDVIPHLAAGFREAFVAWVPSPRLLRPLHEVLRERGWRWDRLRRVPGLRWWPALAVFWLAFAVDIPGTLEVHGPALPFLAALIALPVALSGQWALVGWRVITLTAIVLALVGTPADGQDAVAWPVVLQWVWLAMITLVALRHDRWTTVWVWAASVAVISAGVPDYPGVATTLGVSATALAVIGDLVRTRRQTSRALEEQTELSELEAARRTVLEERARIARELHDVVAHHMSMVVVQAESAPYRLSGLSPGTEAEFASISGSARQALTEIRALLGVLRSDDNDLTRAPQPGLDQLPALISGALRSGLAVQLHTTGTPQPMSAAVELTAYRIVQESLANAARHAPGAPVVVTVDHGTDAVALLIVNEASTTGSPPDRAGASSGPPTGGHGLTGMRERAAVVGGTLRAGPHRDGGYEVAARLPHTREVAP